jgi:hypothetical protein
MKTLTRTSISVAMAAMLLTVGLGGHIAAAGKGEKSEKQVPFSGSVQGRENDVFQGPPPGMLLVDGNGKGIATHLGRFTLAWNVTVNLANGAGTGFAQLIAANGDRIYTTLVGQGEPTDTPGVNRIVEINTITGGTGRFSDAEGSFTLERLVDLTTGFTSGSFHGTITSPGAAH